MNTSNSLSKKFTFLKKLYWDERAFVEYWNKGYFVFTVGINEEIIQKYIQSQEEEETGQAQLEF